MAPTQWEPAWNPRLQTGSLDVDVNSVGLSRSGHRILAFVRDHQARPTAFMMANDSRERFRSLDLPGDCTLITGAVTEGTTREAAKQAPARYGDVQNQAGSHQTQLPGQTHGMARGWEATGDRNEKGG